MNKEDMSESLKGKASMKEMSIFADKDGDTDLVTFSFSFDHFPGKVKNKYSHRLDYSYTTEFAKELANEILKIVTQLDQEKANREKNPVVLVNGHEAIYVGADFFSTYKKGHKHGDE